MGCDQCAAPLHRQLVNHSPHCRCHGELLVNLHQADLHAQVRSKRHLLTECVDYDRQAELEVLVKLIANAEERKRERLERYRAQGGSPFERLPQDCVARIVSMLLEEAEDVDWQRWPFVEQEGAHDHHHQLKRRRQLRRTCPPATMALWSEACRLDYRHIDVRRFLAPGSVGLQVWRAVGNHVRGVLADSVSDEAYVVDLEHLEILRVDLIALWDRPDPTIFVFSAVEASILPLPSRSYGEAPVLQALLDRGNSSLERLIVQSDRRGVQLHDIIAPRSLCHLDRLPHLVNLEIKNLVFTATVYEAMLDAIALHPTLQSLFVQSCRVSPASGKRGSQKASLRNLRRIKLGGIELNGVLWIGMASRLSQATCKLEMDIREPEWRREKRDWWTPRLEEDLLAARTALSTGQQVMANDDGGLELVLPADTYSLFDVVCAVIAAAGKIWAIRLVPASVPTGMSHDQRHSPLGQADVDKLDETFCKVPGLSEVSFAAPVGVSVDEWPGYSISEKQVWKGLLARFGRRGWRVTSSITDKV